MTVIEIPLRTLDDEIEKLEAYAEERESFVRDRINAELRALRWLRHGGRPPSSHYGINGISA